MLRNKVIGVILALAGQGDLLVTTSAAIISQTLISPVSVLDATHGLTLFFKPLYRYSVISTTAEEAKVWGSAVTPKVGALCS